MPKSAGGLAIPQQAVLAAGDGVRLDGNGPEDLAEGDGQEGVIDAAPVRDEEPDDQPRQGSSEQGTPRQAHRLEARLNWARPKA